MTIDSHSKCIATDCTHRQEHPSGWCGRTQPTSQPRRRTSTYTFEVETEAPNDVADILVENCITEVYASGVMIQPKRAFIRFRASSDEVARGIVSRITDAPGVLHTGYGVNHRIVEQ